MMRILLVIDGMQVKSGGPPAVVAGSALVLAQMGHQVHVLSTAEPGDDEEYRRVWKRMLDAGVTLESIPGQGLLGMMGLSREQAHVDALVASCDVVHAHGVWNPILVMACRAARRQGKPYFMSVHGVFDRRAMANELGKFVKKRLAVPLFGFRPLLEASAGIIFGTDVERDESWLPTPNMRMIFVPNGVDKDVGRDAPTDQQRERLYDVLPQTRGWTRVILCRSRIHDGKGIHMLVEAFHRVSDEFPDAHLLIAGLRRDREYEARLERDIASGPGRKRIAMTTELTGPSSQFMYQMCSIFATPSIAEGFSMSLIEGLANGRAMLITRFCHMPIVEEVGAGVIVDPETDDITRGLRQLLARSDDELATMGAAGRALFQERYTWESVAAQLEGEYAQALAAKRA